MLTGVSPHRYEIDAAGRRARGQVDRALDDVRRARLSRGISMARVAETWHARLGDTWTWRTEVPVGADTADRRAIDAILTRRRDRIGIEAVSRIGDAQAEARLVTLKQEATGLLHGPAAGRYTA